MSVHIGLGFFVLWFVLWRTGWRLVKGFSTPDAPTGAERHLAGWMQSRGTG